MFRLFKNLKPVLGIFILAVILLASGAMAELYLPGMMSDIINDGIFLDYEPMYEHETMLNPFGEIDITGDMEGFERDTIPVFEMKDGFSTADLKTVWNERFNSFAITFDFMDIPVKDSRELFNEILLPFMDSLKDYQMYKIQDKYRQKYNDPTIVVNDYIEHYEEEDKEMVKMAIGKLIDYESLLNAKSSSINIKTFLTIYDQDSDEKDSSSVWDNEDAKRLLTSAVLCMKHSENGNLLPIPTMLDENGNTVKVAVNAYGQALDKSQLTYVCDEEILRYTPFPDYEIILCNKVLGYAYKYENGQKWIRNRLGMNQKDIDIAVGENTEESTGFKRLLEIISLSKVGTTTATLSQKEDKTAEEWLTPDGITVQTANMSFIIDRGVKMLLLTLFASACVIVAMFFSSKIVSFFSKILRSKVFTKVESFSLVEFDKFSTASLVTRSTNDINQIQNVFLMILRTTLSAPVTIIGGFIF